MPGRRIGKKATASEVEAYVKRCKSHTCGHPTVAGGACRRHTKRDSLCWAHMIQEGHVQVKPSPGAGQGLFARKSVGRVTHETVFKKDEVIAGQEYGKYEGEAHTAAEVKAMSDARSSYVMKDKGKYIDAIKPTSCIIRWANAPKKRLRGKKNAQFTSKRTGIYAVATKPIKDGEEIVVDYGGKGGYYSK